MRSLALHRRSSILATVVTVVIFLLILIWFRNAAPQRIRHSLHGEASIDNLDPIRNNTLGVSSRNSKRLEWRPALTREQFEKVFVINLPARTDHHDTIVLTAALSNISIEWVEGVTGDQVPDKVLPPGDSKKNLRAGDIGAWRGHINALTA
jgi:hypothetical protein